MKISNEMLLYGGGIICVLAVLLTVVYLLIDRVKTKYLNHALDLEYGKKTNQSHRRRKERK